MNAAMVAENFGEACPASAPFFGYMGAAAALIFANLGAAYGTAKSGVGICSMGVMHPGLIMKSIIPVVMAGVIGIYGFIIAVVVGTKIKEPVGGGSQAVTPQYTLFSAFGHLGSGLTGGLSGLAAGMAIGIVGDAGVRATAQQPKLFVGMILILIFAEALGLYGLIVALIMSSSGGGSCPSA
ncbi:hypothetical protein GUITHDRAFT_156239 [Guillardia theta CCMP2712]|uniref:V-type proton ATPase proteolipid subunit n=2 Tax=Guillardia theta (strain CCMP2712) TaxID=905079 RepID=L1IA80_GUITC|nr:hypothetical protein GUITHDRAFT_156239 [Guillardia theta CCMP2712]EKX32779.1 hypothetical protein GUITHDRAFT_156239 [Guillardia theta CCMP2712]|eukprot:XP_005819759.1 hypothetical protein GUITHDRAFT_156239 [Guillardia theta CCMP2712]